MSMSPWGLFDSPSSEGAQVRRYAHGNGDIAPWPMVEWRNLRRADDVKEVEWRRVAGSGYAVISRTAQDREVVLDGARGPADLAELRRRIESAVAALLPDAVIVAAAPVEAYDDYYYSRHNRYRPLPAYRVTFDDAESTGSTWTGLRVLSSCASRRRHACSAGSTTGCTAPTLRSCCAAADCGTGS